MTDNTLIQAGEAEFSHQQVHQWLSRCDQDGAIVTFTGKVRNHNAGESVATLTLEHYPAMTEKVLRTLADQARTRWPLQQIAIIHRTGTLCPGDDIVLVGVSSAHRAAAFAAAEYLMDRLKTEAPFWKRESTPAGERWLDARDSDQQAADRWTEESS